MDVKLKSKSWVGAPCPDFCEFKLTHSQVFSGECYEVRGSERLTGDALDRLTHRCHILETKGES